MDSHYKTIKIYVGLTEKVKRVLDFSSSEERLPLFVGAAFVMLPR
jgi:hypothetical protein